MLLYVGIDPGKSGAIAVLDGTGLPFDVCKMPTTVRQLVQRFRIIASSHDVRDVGNAEIHVFLERLAAMPSHFRGSIANFSMGMSFGSLQTALAATDLDIRTTLVTPRCWQTAMQCLSGGDKRVTKRKAQERFGDVLKVTHAIADALLIAEYGRRVSQGTLSATGGRRHGQKGK